jgi:hypothetical protein
MRSMLPRQAVLGPLAAMMLALPGPEHASAAEIGFDTITVARRDFEREINEQYENRKRETLSDDIEYTGHRIGPYIVFPTIATSASYDDNLFNQAHDPEGAFHYQVNPSLRLQSDFTRHQLNLLLSGTFASYPEFDDQRFLGGTAATDFVVDIDHANAIGGRASITLEQEERIASDAPAAAARPTDVLRETAAIGFTHDAGRLAASVGADFFANDYEDSVARDGSHIEQDFRDNSSYGAFLRLNYRYLPGYRLTAAVEGRRTEYWEDSPDRSDYYSYRALIGAQLDIDPLWQLDLKVGYGGDLHDDGSAADAFLFSGGIKWFATERMTLALEASRQLNASTFDGGGGVVETGAELRVNYELTHDINLEASIGYRRLDFSIGDREDDVYKLGLGASYQLNENVIFTFGYEHLTRDSSLSQYDIDDNRFTVGMKYRF